MKSLFRLCLFSLLASSCIEEVDFELDKYVKVLSLDRSSFAEKVIELENGDLMILGEMGIGAFDLESTGQGTQPNELEDQAPFISITDANGNLKMLRMYPLEDFDAQYDLNALGLGSGEFELLGINNITSFHNVVQTGDGGFVVHAQSLGFGLINPITGEVDLSEAGDQNYNDFLYRLDADYNVEKIVSMQAFPGWDFTSRIRGRLKALANDQVGFLMSQRQRLLDQLNSSGMTFLHLQPNLDTVRISDIELETDLIAYDFTTDPENNISFLTTTERHFEVFQMPLEEIVTSRFAESTKNSTLIAGEAVQGQNTDEQWIEQLPDGSYILVYTQPLLGIVYERRDQNFALINGPVDLRGENSYPNATIRATRAVSITQNGDILIYVLVIPGNEGAEIESLYGELFRISPFGITVFEQRIDGIPGDVIETQDGSIVAVSNPSYNGSLQKIQITKLDANGRLN